MTRTSVCASAHRQKRVSASRSARQGRAHVSPFCAVAMVEGTAYHTPYRIRRGRTVAPRSVTFCDWVGRLRAVPHGRQRANSKVLPADGERSVPAGRNGGCPGDGRCGRRAESGTGRAGGPPFLAVAVSVPGARGRGTSAAALAPACAVCLPRCLPTSAWAAGHAARVRLVPSS